MKITLKDVEKATSLAASVFFYQLCLYCLDYYFDITIPRVTFECMVLQSALFIISLIGLFVISYINYREEKKE